MSLDWNRKSLSKIETKTSLLPFSFELLSVHEKSKLHTTESARSWVHKIVLDSLEAHYADLNIHEKNK